MLAGHRPQRCQQKKRSRKQRHTEYAVKLLDSLTGRRRKGELMTELPWQTSKSLHRLCDFMELLKARS